MAISIEIKNGTVNLVSAKTRKGSVTVKNTHSFSYPEEWFDIVGITHMREFAQLLKEELHVLGNNEKDCYICVNNSNIIYRELLTPKLDAKKLPLLVRSEMMDELNLTPDYVIDYVILDDFYNEELSEGNYRILAVAIQQSAVVAYIELCKQLKLNLLSITSATNSVIKLVDQIPELKSLDQVVIADVSSGQLKLFMFEFGKYIITRNTRVATYTGYNKEEIILDVEDSINKMNQFAYTRGPKTGIKKVVLFGIDELLEVIKHSVEDGLAINCEIFNKPRGINYKGTFQTQFLNACGSLLRE